MTAKKQLTATAVLALALALMGLFWHALCTASTTYHASAMVGETLPRFSLPTLGNATQTFSSTTLRGRVNLLNVWASWCSACQREHAMLMRIKDTYHVPIYGVLYRDQASNALAFLKRSGNPYVAVGDDSGGDVAVDLGIYGTPETYIISPEGKIIYRHIGIITDSVWEKEMYPLIKRYEHT
jgi:cytochrome c biogenesis protein CcmG/thiol:disulfide interchange protein DsbE